MIGVPAYLEHWFTLKDRATPDAKNVAVYNKLFTEYGKIYTQTKDVMARLGK